MQTPAQVAKRANVHVSSIRNWTRDYASLLSLHSQGQSGQRLYTDQDVEVLCTIAALRKSGVPPKDVAERIRNKEVPPVVDATPTRNAQDALEGLETTQDAPLALQIGYSALQRQIDALERRVEAKREDEIRQAEIRGATLALVAGGFVLWVLWLAANSLP